jgi:hypothetical protein
LAKGSAHAHGIYFAMLELAKKYDVSVKEIEETMLRSFLIERFALDVTIQKRKSQ